jgi:tetratricopeptide (TPR) repeat protein
MAAHLASGEQRAVAALGFRAPVKVAWGLAFMTQLFDHLASGASLEVAVARARQAQAEDDPAWSLPLLFAPERDPFLREAQAATASRGVIVREPGSVSRDGIAPAPGSASRSVIVPAPDATRSSASPPRPGSVSRDVIAPASGSASHGVTASRSVIDLESGAPLRSLLPVPPRPYFTARSAQLDALRAWRETPGAAVLTALAGEGGVGKTEIARKVAHDAHATGTPVIWIERPDREIGRSLMAMIRQAVPEYRPPDAATLDDLHAYMTRELGPHRGLLVLDDVEQASAVATLIPGPAWNILVTTRQRSLLPAVVELDVEPLDPDDAVELLAKIAEDGAAFGPDEAGAARDLVVALGGLPLAIELAGDLVRRGVGLDEIRQATESADGLADDSIAGRVERVMTRSLAGLAAGDEAAWALVAALPSAGATEQDVALGLDEPEARAGRRLFRLRQANLLRLSPAQARYTMHPLARQIARRRARAAGTWEAGLSAAAKVVRAAAEWCVEPLGRDSELARRRWKARREFLDTLDPTHWQPETAGANDVAMALGYADRFRALDCVPDERATLLEAAANLARSPETLAIVHEACGDLRQFRKDLDGAEADYARALDLFTAVQDNLGLANVHKARGDLRRFRDNLDGAEADYARALHLFTAVQDNLGLANVHMARGHLRRHRDDLDGVEADYARALELYTAVQDNLGLANVHKARGDLRLRRDDLDGAEADYVRALDLFTAVQDNLGLANVHKARGNLRLRRDDLDGAEADYARALALFTAVQDNLGLANVHQVRGDLHARTGALDRAESFYLDALRLYERVQNSLGMSNVLAELAQTHARLGDYAGARAYALRAKPLARAFHNQYAANIVARVLAWAGDTREE